MENTYSLKEFLSKFESYAFVCVCKKCDSNFTKQMPIDVFLKTAIEAGFADIITLKEWKKLNHVAVQNFIAGK